MQVAVRNRRSKAFPNPSSTLRICIDPCPRPARMQQIDGVVLQAIAHATFVEGTVPRANTPENLLNHSVLVSLRIRLETVSLETSWVRISLIAQEAVDFLSNHDLERVARPSIEIPQRVMRHTQFFPESSQLYLQGRTREITVTISRS